MLPPRIRRLFRLPLRDEADRRAARRFDDIEEEIRLHLDLRVQQLMQHGLPADEARQRALQKFGPLAEARPRLDAANQYREDRVRLREKFDALRQDLRFTLRGLARRPTFSIAVIATLALGVGANATMFGIIDRLLLRAPNFLSAPDRTGRVYLRRTSAEKEDVIRYFQYRTFLDLVGGTTSFSHAAAISTNQLVLGEAEDARQENVTSATGAFWSFFDARPALGRFFSPADDSLPVGRPVIVLSYSQWRSRFGGDSSVIGKPLRVSRNMFTIIGVAPEGFNGVEQQPVAAWIPMTAASNQQFVTRDAVRPDLTWYRTYLISWIEVIVRRKPGVSLEQANVDLATAYRRSYATYVAERPATRRSVELTRPRAEMSSILPDRGPVGRAEAKVALWLGGVSLLVLLIACANVASLLLSRGLERRREYAVRLALGVSRVRLIAPAILEGTSLALLGGIVGVIAAAAAGGVLRRAVLPDLAQQDTVLGGAIDWRVMAFAFGVSLLAGLLSSVAPALHAAGHDVATALRAGARGSGGGRGGRLRAGLLVMQGTLSVLLLVGSGLFVRSLHNVRSLDLGYDPSRLLYLTLDMRGTTLEAPQHIALRDQLLQRAEALPEVQDAAVTLSVPYRLIIGETIRVPGIDSSRMPDVLLNAVSPKYFDVAGTRIIRGRGFTDTDRQGSAPVVVISEGTANAIWPREQALGRCIKVGSDTAPCSEVIGIAKDLRLNLREPPAQHVYVPAAQGEFHRAGMYVRTRGDAREQAEVVRRELQRLVPGRVFVRVLPVRDVVDPSYQSWRLGATMFTLFGVLALIVAAVGLYSVIAYNVAQRTHELGVRIALGATTSDVLRLVVGEGLRVSAIAIGLGIALALLAGRWVRPLLYEVSERDPITLTLVAVALLIVGAVAGFIPARRAARVDPTESLRWN